VALTWAGGKPQGAKKHPWQRTVAFKSQNMYERRPGNRGGDLCEMIREWQMRLCKLVSISLRASFTQVHYKGETMGSPGSSLNGFCSSTK
jgi:hypothetical protein